MSHLRTLVVCPGRGSYQRTHLNSLANRSPEVARLVQQVDHFRATRGLTTISKLDQANRFSASKHVAGVHASLLTFTCSMADAIELSTQHEVVGYTGNSMGWYTALALSGALSLNDALTLIQTMADFQVGNPLGGQVLYPIADASWEESAEQLNAVNNALNTIPNLWLSIHLGSFVVFGGDEAALKQLNATLPVIQRTKSSFPMRLPLHSAFHTPLLQRTSQQAQEALDALNFHPPRVPLYNGHGVRFRPLSASPSQLRHYTLGPQVVQPYDFQLALRCAMRDLGPERVVLLGPGNSLGGPSACILTQEGWSGVRSRSDFERLQAHSPLLFSFGVAEQKATLT